MNDNEILRQYWGVTAPFQAGDGASVHMKALYTALSNAPVAFTATETLKHIAETVEALKQAPPDERLAFVFEALGGWERRGPLQLQLALRGLISKLLRGGLMLSSTDAVRLVEAVTAERQSYPYKAVLSAVAKAPMTRELKEALSRLKPKITYWHQDSEDLRERIDVLVGGEREEPVVACGTWSKQVLVEIGQTAKASEWMQLLAHGRSLTESTASKKWSAEAVKLADGIGRGEVLEAARRWLALGPMPEMPGMQMLDDEADYQKGFIWALGALGDPSIARDIADFAFLCFKKIPEFGAVSHRVGNACVNALAVMPGLEAVAQISRLAMRVKYDVAKRLTEKALVEAAGRNGVSRDDIEAMSVPSFGLDTNGVRVELLGICEARLKASSEGVAIEWWREGKQVKSVPAEVKAGYAEALAELKKSVKELDAVLSTERLRIERSLLTQSSCPFERWKAWYVDHPVTSIFAKRLIWEVGERTAIWHDGGLVDWSGNVVEAAQDATVRLWHPIRADVQTVLSWRCWLEDHGVRQPFKQAHREVYILTDAERETRVYSNRFAAHIVKQHQFAALCRERGWQFHLMGRWDSANTPYLELPRYGLRAEFEVEFPRDEEVSGHNVFLTIRTDKVQFLPPKAVPNRLNPLEGPGVPLEEIPPVVFSEVMRDVDLLVGVTSIGADPAWSPEHPFQDYWRTFAFGELSTFAENRRSILEGLLPKLSIRDKCRLEGRFLVVRGDWHEYRIHLGSGNVLMEPGSRYLCIVQGPGDSAARVQLPFEGDRTLAIIISKAFILANDRAIRDERILIQIRPS